MTHLGPAAPAGLHCYRGAQFGEEYRDNLFACQFNMSKVSRHILKEKGSTYETTDSDFVVSDNRDFHPTDVIEDADGSLLIIDTGGWYRLCCPSSVMEKKDVLGAIYRVRKEQSGTRVERNKADQPDKEKVNELIDLPPHLRRRAAERMGREGSAIYIPNLFRALADEKNDAVLDTALTRALIDIGDAKATRAGLTHKSDRVKRAALAALEQMPDGKLTAAEVLPHLAVTPSALHGSAWWVAGRHPDWGDDLVGHFRERLKKLNEEPFPVEHLARFAGREAVQKLMAEFLPDKAARLTVLIAMRESRLNDLPACWEEPLAVALADDFGPVTALTVFKGVRVSAEKYAALIERAKQKLEAKGKQWDEHEWQFVLACSPAGALPAEDDAFADAVVRLKEGQGPQPYRDALTRAKLTAKQLEELAAALPSISPFHWPDLLAPFTRTTDEKVGAALVAALRTKGMKSVIRVEQVKPTLDKYPKGVQEQAAKLYAELEEATNGQREKLDTLLKDTQAGDVRKGQAVFNSAKAACTACHRIAYVGGAVGPDLTKIGGIRSKRDLLEAIVFPSASFVRSYEPVKVETKSGKSYNGILKSDSGDEVVLTVSATEEVRIPRKEIDEMKPGTVSIMPAGLDQQLTKQELADLVAFLRSLK